MGSSTMEVKLLLVLTVILSASISNGQENGDKKVSSRDRLRALFNRRRLGEKGNNNLEKLRTNRIIPKVQNSAEEPQEEEGQIVSVSVSTSESFSTSRERPADTMEKTKSPGIDVSKNKRIEESKEVKPHDIKVTTTRPSLSQRLKLRKNKTNNQQDILNSLLSRISNQKQVPIRKTSLTRPRKFRPSTRREQLRKKAESALVSGEEKPKRFKLRFRKPSVETNTESIESDDNIQEQELKIQGMVDISATASTSKQEKEVAKEIKEVIMAEKEPSPSSPEPKFNSFPGKDIKTKTIPNQIMIKATTTSTPLISKPEVQASLAQKKPGSLFTGNISTQSEEIPTPNKELLFKNTEGLDALTRLKLIAKTLTPKKEPLITRNQANENQQRLILKTSEVQEIETSESDQIRSLANPMIQPAFIINNIPSAENIELIELPRTTVEDTKQNQFEIKFRTINADAVNSIGKQEFIPKRQSQPLLRHQNPINVPTIIREDKPKARIIVTEQRLMPVNKIVNSLPIQSIQRVPPVERIPLPTALPFKLPEFFMEPFSNPNLEQKFLQQESTNSIFNNIGQPTGQIGVVQGHPQVCEDFF